VAFLAKNLAFCFKSWLHSSIKIWSLCIQVENIIRQTTTVGSRHRDHATTGSTLKGMNSALAFYFFGKTTVKFPQREFLIATIIIFSGENLDGKLTIERFLNFQEQLQREILSLEFARKSPSATSGNISEKDFADLLLTYADYSAKKRAAVLKRVRKKYPNNADQIGISLEDYIQIFSLLIHIDDVDKVSGITSAACLHTWVK